MILTLLWALNSSYECIKAQYCLQMYNRIIISNFHWNLIIISQFLSFFCYFFSFLNFGPFWAIFWPPQIPGVPKLFGYGARFIPGAPEMSSSFKKLLHDNFFLYLVQKPWYGHFHYFGAFWGASRGPWVIKYDESHFESCNDKF